MTTLRTLALTLAALTIPGAWVLAVASAVAR
jgi:hypothetical protein